MTKILERNAAELIMVVLTTIILLSSCGSTQEMKECCKKTAQEVYEYEELVMDCENCDEIE